MPLLLLAAFLVLYLQNGEAFLTPGSSGRRRLSNAHVHCRANTRSRLYLGEGSIVDGDSIEREEEELDVYGKLRNELKGTNLFLVGMMGSGKSAVGDAIGRKMGYRYIDTDEVAEYMIEMPIADFFAKDGEQEFRQVEHKILLELAQYTRTVISTGGGIVEFSENWGILHHGIIVFLDVSPEVIYERLSANPEEIKKRPLLHGGDALEKLNEIRDKRLNLYNQADVKVIISKDLSIEEVDELVASTVLDTIKANPPQWMTWKANKEKEMRNNLFKDDADNVLQ
jgi:shikimate kinase